MPESNTTGGRNQPGTTAEAASSSDTVSDAVSAALRTVDISQIMAASGASGSLSVDRIELGDATIDRLVIQDLTAGLQVGRTQLEDVRFLLDLRLAVDWWYDFGWLGSDSGSESLGSLSFGLPLGNILVPSLQDINLSVPSAVVNDAQAEVSPITNLDLGGARFHDLRVDDTTLPSSGFDVSGLQFGALTLSNVDVPAASSQRLSLGDLTPKRPLKLPMAEVRGIKVPAARVPAVSSQGSVDINDAQATRRGVSLSFGIFGFTFWVRPVFDIHIGALTLNDVAASAAIKRVRIEELSSPVTIRGVLMGDLQLEQLTVNKISI